VIAQPDEYPRSIQKYLEVSMSRNPLDSEFNEADNFGDGRADNTETLKEKIDDIASRAKDRAGQWTDAASETVDQQRENISTRLDRAASTLHENAQRVPGGPRTVNAAHRFADGMEATASYLREHDFADMRDDLINVCKRRPVQALVCAAAFGFLLGRSVRR
jgi:ElaB/YqjD/DUF883 family membrane-anchored ribosome-binding protein